MTQSIVANPKGYEVADADIHEMIKGLPSAEEYPDDEYRVMVTPKTPDPRQMGLDITEPSHSIELCFRKYRIEVFPFCAWRYEGMSY